MHEPIDSFRFCDPMTATVLRTWIAREGPHAIPWTPLRKPLTECTVALISSAGVALKTDAPFDQEGERRHPWWGDPSYRVVPAEATEHDVGIYHLHIDPRFGQQDLNCIFPLERLAELAAAGEVGRSAPRHYSFMGYTIQPEQLLRDSVPAMIAGLKADEVDAVLLVPV